MLFRFVRGSLRRAARVIAVSEFTRSDVVDRYGLEPGKVVAIPNGVGERFRPLAEAAQTRVHDRFGIKRPYMLCVGALQARKNVPLAIEAYARLMGRGTDCELVIAGGDKAAAGTGWMRSSGARLTGRVHLVGHVEERRCRRSTARPKALVFPSLYEGFGLRPWRPWPRHARDREQHHRLARGRGRRGPHGRPAQHRGARRAMGRVLDDSELRERLVAAGLARAANFTWARAAAAPPASTARCSRERRRRNDRLPRPARPPR